MSVGAVMKRAMEALADSFWSVLEIPSFWRSSCHALAIDSARARLLSSSVRTMNRQGWALWAEGAHVAASKISFMSAFGMGACVYFLMLRLSRMV